MGLKTAIRRLANRFGYDILKIDPNLEIPYFQQALNRWKSFPLDFKSVIDVGASDGRWSRQFAGAFADKRYLLVDANPVHEPALKKVCSANPNWSYKRCAVGQKEGLFYFDGTDPLGGHLSEQQLGPTYKPCPVSTLDGLTQEFNLPQPILVKLDTHGVEVPILEGAKQCLPHITGLAVEVYNFEGSAPQVPFWEFCRYLRQLNFRPLDLWDVLHRPKDKVLWQFDILFVRADFPLLQDPRFR
jgi:FkbM family methyltransferase